MQRQFVEQGLFGAPARLAQEQRRDCVSQAVP